MGPKVSLSKLAFFFFNSFVGYGLSSFSKLDFFGRMRIEEKKEVLG